MRFNRPAASQIPYAFQLSSQVQRLRSLAVPCDQPEPKPGQVSRRRLLRDQQHIGALRAQVDAIHLSPAVQGYILALVRGTRALAERETGAKRYLNFGASPRASLALYQSGRALAWLRGQDYLSPELIQELAPDVLRHRIGLTYEAEAEEITPDKIVAQVVERTPVPVTT